MSIIQIFQLVYLNLYMYIKNDYFYLFIVLDSGSDVCIGFTMMRTFFLKFFLACRHFLKNLKYFNFYCGCGIL